MNRYQVEVVEKISHLVTVFAENEQEAREKVLTFNGGDDHLIASVELKCVSVKSLEDVIEVGDNGRHD